MDILIYPGSQYRTIKYAYLKRLAVILNTDFSREFVQISSLKIFKYPLSAAEFHVSEKNDRLWDDMRHRHSETAVTRFSFAVSQNFRSHFICLSKVNNANAWTLHRISLRQKRKTEKFLRSGIEYVFV